MDRRIEKTQKALQDAILELLRDTPIEQLEIQAITDKANTARVTFYRHYGTKEELLIDATQGIYEDLKPTIVAPTIEEMICADHVPVVRLLFAFLDQDRALHKTLLTGSTSALIQQKLRDIINQQLKLSFEKSPDYHDVPIEIISNQIASVAIGNAMWWLADDLPYSVDYMARLTHWMGVCGTMTMIGRGKDLQLPDGEWYLPE